MSKPSKEMKTCKDGLIRVKRWEDFCRPMPLSEKLNDWFVGVAADPDLKTSEKLVAAALGLLHHNSGTGCLIPLYETIATETLGGSLSESTVERAIAGLCDRGWIEKALWVDWRGMTRGCVFRLTSPSGDSASAATGAASAPPPETATVLPLRPHSCSHSDSASAAHNLEEISRKTGTGNETIEELTFVDDAGGGCAALTGSVVGLTPSSSPVGNERHTGEEEREDTTGLRKNSAAQVPPDLTDAIAEHLFAIFSGRDRNTQSMALHPDKLDLSIRQRLLAKFQIDVAASPVALMPYDSKINAAIDRVRNALGLQSLIPAMAGMAGNSRVGVTEEVTAPVPVTPLVPLDQVPVPSHSDAEIERMMRELSNTSDYSQPGYDDFKQRLLAMVQPAA